MTTGKIEQWSTYRGPFDAPELQPQVQGVLDGCHVLTSRLVRTEGRVIFTETGSQYELGEPDPLFVEWLASNDYQFDPDNPIKVVMKPAKLQPPKVEGPRSERCAKSILHARPRKNTSGGGS